MSSDGCRKCKAEGVRTSHVQPRSLALRGRSQFSVGPRTAFLRVRWEFPRSIPDDPCVHQDAFANSAFSHEICPL